MLSIIIPTYRNPKYLDLCLKSATENRIHDTTEIIVVIDGFVDESMPIVEKYDGVMVIPLEQNQGMQAAINIGVMQSNNQYVCVVNDDNVFPTNYDHRIMQEVGKCHRTDDDKFVLTVNQVEPIGPGMFAHDVYDFGTSVDSFRYIEWLSTEPDISRDELNENGHIFPFVVAKKYYLAVGGLDTFYDSPNVCDWDMFLKFELLGFRFPRTYALHLYHFGSVVTRQGAEAQQFMDRQNKAMQTYTWKWGAHPHNEPESNSKFPPNREFRGFKV